MVGLTQDVALEIAQGAARLQPQLVDQVLASAAEHLERVGLPAGAVERGRQDRGRAFPPRMRGDVSFQRRDGGAVAPLEPRREVEVPWPLVEPGLRRLDLLRVGTSRGVVGGGRYFRRTADTSWARTRWLAVSGSLPTRAR